MGTKNFDTKLKQVLENRRITPSNSSWEKLSHQLDHEKETFKKRFWWLGIAAVFLGGILIGSLVFNGKETLSETQNSIVDDSSKDTPLEEKTSIPKEATTKQPKIISSPGKGLVRAEKEKSPAKKPKEPAGMVQATKKRNLEKPVRKAITTPEPKSGFSAKKTGKLFENTSKGQVKTRVTNVEIEKLLREAKRKIKNQNFVQPTTNKVNAQVLLQHVEQKLQQSPSNRILGIVKDKLIQLASTSRVFD